MSFAYYAALNRMQPSSAANECLMCKQKTIAFYGASKSFECSKMKVSN